MHCPQHAGYELINAISLLHQRHQRSYAALVVRPTSEMGKDELLKRIDLVLKSHKIRDSFVTALSLSGCSIEVCPSGASPFIWIIDRFQTYVFLVLKRP